MASHHCVTWAGASALLARTSCRRPRSTMSAPPLAGHRGERRHRRDDLHADDRAVDVGLHGGSDAGVARGQEALRGQAGDGRRGRCRGQRQLPVDRAGGDAGNAAGRQPVAGVERHRQRAAARRPARRDGGQAGRAGRAGVWRTPASSAEEATAGQPRSAAPATRAVPGPPDTPATVNGAGPAGPGGGQRVVQADRGQPQRVDGRGGAAGGAAGRRRVGGQVWSRPSAGRVPASSW